MIRKSIWVGLLMAIGTVALWPEPAAACGGFMCDGGGVAGPTPVVQAGERVLFEKRQDGTIRAYVQIRYQQGASVGFSWLVPVMGVPELGVADEATFDQLDAASARAAQLLAEADGERRKVVESHDALDAAARRAKVAEGARDDAARRAERAGSVGVSWETARA